MLIQIQFESESQRAVPGEAGVVGGAASSPSSPTTLQLTASDPLGKISSGWERTEEKEFFFLQFVDDVRRNFGHGSSLPGLSPRESQKLRRHHGFYVTEQMAGEL